MTHTINSNTNLLSIDITRTHTHMKKSPRGKKESGKEMRRDRVKKIERRKKKKKRKENLIKKSMNKFKIK